MLRSDDVIVFDLGGVVLRICRTWAEGCRAAGIPVREDVLDRFEDPGLPALVDRYQQGAMDLPAFARELSAAVGGAYDPAEVERVHRAWIVGEYPGAAALLAELRERGHRVAALSNTCGAHWQQMPEFPAFRAFDVRFGSHELGVCKPDPQAYALAQTGLGVDASSIVYFDDLPANVAAARQHGWRAERVDPLDDPVAQIRAFLGLVETSATGH